MFIQVFIPNSFHPLHATRPPVRTVRSNSQFNIESILGRNMTMFDHKVFNNHGFLLLTKGFDLNTMNLQFKQYLVTIY